MTALAKLPNLSADLLALIGSYGLARTDGVSEVERVHRWQQLIDGIKQYATDCVAASLFPAELGGVPVAWTVVGPDGKSSIGGWMDMRVHEAAQAWAVVREGHRYAYAYEGTTPRAAEAMTGEVWVRAWRNRFIDERTTKYQAEGETYEMARTNAEYDANQFAECFAKALTPPSAKGE